MNRMTLIITIRKDCIISEDDCDDHLDTHSISPLKIFLICCLVTTFLFVCYTIFNKTCRAFRTRWRISSRTSNRIIRGHENTNNIDHSHQDMAHEDHEPAVFHPIWLINTIGLDQSVIDSIEIFKYRKQDGLLDGTEHDCPVCLGMFQEEESLRLLPKCSHAFHVACIDTWLRSHTNCPLCRAPVVNNRVNQNSVESSAQEGGQSETVGEEATAQEIDTNDEDLEKGLISGVRVLSDLTERSCEKTEPIRRSISTGSSWFAADLESGESVVSNKTGSSSSMLSRSLFEQTKNEDRGNMKL